MASFSVSYPKSSAFPQCGSRPENPQQQQQQRQHSKISFPRSRTSFLAGSSLDQSPFLRIQGNSENHSAVRKVQGQLNAVAAEKSSNSAPVSEANLEGSPPGRKDGQAEEPALQNAVPDASSISAFMAQVADLIKLVDSKDIMELQLKQLDCELIIRKKEALQQTPTGAPVYMMQPPPPQAMVPSQPPPAQGIAPASAGPAPSAPVQALPAPASKSSHPPLKCPMAGTFYRSPGPGEPPFVKVGDKVQKGQVLCIIEAMKLMNEIEADQSGTLTEILMDDGKPVSLDTPLFIIAP